MLKFPALKTTCITLISEEGAGKGTLLYLLEKIMGSVKVMETTEPDKHVWGSFNGAMKDCFLVNCNELDMKAQQEAEGKIKGLITDPKITINNKGLNKFEVLSYHRFIITTNNEEPIVTKSDDRRNIIIRSSDEKCGDKDYFKKLYELLDDDNVVKTCFEYFKQIPDMKDFGSIHPPETEYHAQLKELSKSPIETWLEYFTQQNQDRDYIELKSQSIYEKFNDWSIDNGIEYKIDALKLMVRINRLNINGIEKKHTKNGNFTKFDIDKMKKHFGIGCLL